MRKLSTCLAFLVALLAASAATTPLLAETRAALVVGNGSYRATTPLANAPNDARDVAAALKTAGFAVTVVLDADKRQLDTALRTFADRLAKVDVALFYYAGHGLQVGLQNFLVPVDATLARERDLEFEAVKLEVVLRLMEGEREGRTSIVLLDACRDNPLAQSLSRTMGTRGIAVAKGLAATPAGLGTFIAYATQPGNVALDGKGANSPFTAALIRHMGVKGRNLSATMIEVRNEVVQVTGGLQVPWDHSAMTREFQFLPASGGTGFAPAPSPQPSATEVAALQERLRALEEQARQREAQGRSKIADPAPAAEPPRASGAASGFGEEANVRFDGIKMRQMTQPGPAACREACRRERNCVGWQHGRRPPMTGQCHIFSRIEARHEDANWSGGMRAGSALPDEQSAVTGDARSVAARLGKASRSERGFAIHDGVSVMGEMVKMSSADSPAGCQAVCRNTPGCVVAMYNDFFRGKNVACQVFREISSTMKAASATTMVRMD